MIQEGVVGYRLANNLWIDAGIYLSHIGLESWISRDNNFIGNEQSDSLASRTRFFNDVVLKFSVSPLFQLAGMVDYGLEEKANGSGNSYWYDMMVLGRFQATPSFALTGRVEYYGDKDQVIVKTGTPDGFQIYGSSITAEVAVAPNLLWRLEGRLPSSKDRIYPTNDSAKLSERNGFVVTSLTLTL